jgi:PAC2 family
VSTGNVGQLAVDLLISYGSSHESLTWIGSIETAHLLPACGYEAYPGQPPRLVTTLELYVFDKRKIAVVQQRAPVVSSANAEFAADLLTWGKESGFQVRCFYRSLLSVHCLLRKYLDLSDDTQAKLANVIVQCGCGSTHVQCKNLVMTTEMLLLHASSVDEVCNCTSQRPPH